MFGVHLWKWCGTATQKHIGSSPTINGTKTTVDATKNNTLPGRLGHFNIVQHISTYFNCGLLFHLFHHTCAHPFRRCRRAAVCAWAASGAPGSRGSVWSLTTPTNTRNARTAGGHGEPTRLWGEKVGKNNYSDNTDNSDIIVIILIIVIVVIIMIVIIMIIVIMLIIVTMM